jgi:hypothetical protein
MTGPILPSISSIIGATGGTDSGEPLPAAIADPRFPSLAMTFGKGAPGRIAITAAPCFKKSLRLFIPLLIADHCPDLNQYVKVSLKGILPQRRRGAEKYRESASSVKKYCKYLFC